MCIKLSKIVIETVEGSLWSTGGDRFPRGQGQMKHGVGARTTLNIYRGRAIGQKAQITLFVICIYVLDSSVSFD